MAKTATSVMAPVTFVTVSGLAVEYVAPPTPSVQRARW